jgi:hypothetical protein
MKSELSWKLLYAAREKAAKEGEDIAETYGFTRPPVDPFEIALAERSLIHLEEHDFGNAFDGLIRFVGPRFLICCNTKYNAWPHKGARHTKVVFTLAHELGHFFLPGHRMYLVRSKKPHESFTEFSADPLVEQQADSFATGLLLPGYLFKPVVNRENFPSQRTLGDARREFHVSLTGMLVRWTQLSDFPCTTIVIHNGRIQYGWISSALRSRGAFRLRYGQQVMGRDAKQFIETDATASSYREGHGAGAIRNWIDFDETKLLTDEHYFAIPHSGTVWVTAFADEADLEGRTWDDD